MFLIIASHARLKTPKLQGVAGRERIIKTTALLRRENKSGLIRKTIDSD